MTYRRNNAAVKNELAITVIESVPMEVDEKTIEEYKTLNDKLDNLMFKIKNRKERKNNQR